MASSTCPSTSSPSTRAEAWAAKTEAKSRSARRRLSIDPTRSRLTRSVTSASARSRRVGAASASSGMSEKPRSISSIRRATYGSAAVRRPTSTFASFSTPSARFPDSSRAWTSVIAASVSAGRNPRSRAYPRTRPANSIVGGRTAAPRGRSRGRSPAAADGPPALGPLDVRADALDLRVERLRSEVDAPQSFEHLLDRGEFVAHRVEVLGELADSVDRLLACGQRLGIDLQAERLPRAIHRGEYVARVPAEAAGLGDPRSDLVQ